MKAMAIVGIATLLAGRVWAQETQVVKIEPGVTRLAEIGAYRVGYQRFGETVVMMPPGWVGHFEANSGVSYTPWAQQAGKETILLHCPWRGGTGISFVEYDLELPAVQPLVFSFAIAMQQGVSENSDGATFRALIRAGGESRVLCDEHRKATEWKEFQVDLSPWAAHPHPDPLPGRERGTRITLRLETAPGPNNNPGWDYSLWGDARIVAGAPLSDAERIEAALRVRARWREALRATNLLALANRGDVGCRPTCDDRFENEIRREGHGFVFAYRGNDLKMQYVLAANCDPGEIVAAVEDLEPFAVAQGLGPAGAAMTWRLESARVDGERLRVRGRYESATAQWPVAFSIGIAGKTLVIEVEGPPGPQGFALGSLGPVALRRVVAVPYLAAGDIRYLPHNGLFYSAFLDWAATNASSHNGTTAHYDALTDGRRNPIRETGYITVSPDLREVLPNIPLPPSPYLKELAPRVMLDIWGGTFAENAQTIRDLADYGVTGAAMIKHMWQRGGYDNEYPTVLPANANLGGDDGLRELARAAAQAGHLFALHENYVDFYPNSELYDEKEVARDAQGGLQTAWYNAATRVQSYATRPTAMLKYARQFALEIHARYGTSAAYLDVHTCVPPWFHVDFDAAAEGAGMARTVYDANLALFRFEREAHRGPLFGEGNNHFYWAGSVDGVEAQVAGGESAPLLLDFDLLKLHPQMLNHGMGYHERWLREGYGGNSAGFVPPQYRMDRYRSMEIAYGHAGFIAHQVFALPSYAAKEHHLVSPVQALYGAARAVAIEYEVSGRMADVSDAVAAGVLDRVRVRYDSGFQVWVNHRADEWRVGDDVIPQDCFLARGPGLVAYSGERGDVFCDYAETPQSIFADARSVIVTPWRDITPRVASFEAAGARRFRVTYEWQVDEALDRDYHVFVHFSGAGTDEDIVFQQDHEPPVPTSQWRPGQVVRDGPYEIAVPQAAGEAFTWTIGLYRESRLWLRGRPDRHGRIVLGEIKVGTDGGVTFAPTPQQEWRREVEEYERRMNREGGMIDFGKVATDGSVFIRREEEALRLTPIPRERATTVSLRLADLGLGWPAAQVSARGADGSELRRWQTQPSDGILTLRLEEPGARWYLLEGGSAQ